MHARIRRFVDNTGNPGEVFKQLLPLLTVPNDRLSIDEDNRQVWLKAMLQAAHDGIVKPVDEGTDEEARDKIVYTEKTYLFKIVHNMLCNLRYIPFTEVKTVFTATIKEFLEGQRYTLLTDKTSKPRYQPYILVILPSFQSLGYWYTCCLFMSIIMEQAKANNKDEWPLPVDIITLKELRSRVAEEAEQCIDDPSYLNHTFVCLDMYIPTPDHPYYIYTQDMELATPTDAPVDLVLLAPFASNLAKETIFNKQLLQKGQYKPFQRSFTSTLNLHDIRESINSTVLNNPHMAKRIPAKLLETGNTRNKMFVQNAIKSTSLVSFAFDFPMEPFGVGRLLTGFYYADYEGRTAVAKLAAALQLMEKPLLKDRDELLDKKGGFTWWDTPEVARLLSEMYAHVFENE